MAAAARSLTTKFTEIVGSVGRTSKTIIYGAACVGAIGISYSAYKMYIRLGRRSKRFRTTRGRNRYCFAPDFIPDNNILLTAIQLTMDRDLRDEDRVLLRKRLHRELIADDGSQQAIDFTVGADRWFGDEGGSPSEDERTRWLDYVTNYYNRPDRAHQVVEDALDYVFSTQYAQLRNDRRRDNYVRDLIYESSRSGRLLGALSIFLAEWKSFLYEALGMDLCAATR